MTALPRLSTTAVRYPRTAGPYDTPVCPTCDLGIGGPIYPEFPTEVCACIPDPEPMTLFAVPSPTEAAQSHARKVLAMVRYAHKRMEEAGYPLGTLPMTSRDLIARAAGDARTDVALMDLVIETAICTARTQLEAPTPVTPAVEAPNEAPRTVKRWCDCVITYTSTWAGPYKARLEVTGVVLDTPCGWHHDAQTGLRDARMGLGL